MKYSHQPHTYRGRTKGAGYRGPHPSEPGFYEWHERDLQVSLTDLKQATAEGNARLVKIYSRQVRETKRILAERAEVLQ